MRPITAPIFAAICRQIALFFIICFALILPASAEELENGGMVAGVITVSHQTIIYTFEAEQSNSIALSLSATFGIDLALVAPSGTRLRVSGVGVLTYDNLPETGVYQVEVNARAATGEFGLHFVLLPGANELGALGIAEMKSDVITQGDLDTFTINATAGESIVLSLGGNFTRWMFLYAPDGSQVANSLGSGRIEYTSVPEDGIYTVLIRGYTNNDFGSYELHIARIPGANEHGEIVDGSLVAGLLTSGDLDTYSFVAEPGDTVDPALTASFSIAVALYNPSGGRISSTIYPLTEGGLYTLVVYSPLLQTGEYQLAFSRQHRLISYAALGDSYSSGEGVFPFVGSFGFRTACNRSANAYSAFVRVPFTSTALSKRDDAVYDFYACTGAVTDNIRRNGEGQYGEPPQAILPQIRSRDLITLTIGGNDTYFAPILAFCLLHENCPEAKAFEPYSDLKLKDLFPQWIDVVKRRLINTYSELRTATFNRTTILAIDYPLVVSGNECPLVAVPFSPENRLSASEQAWMRESNLLLNAAIAQAASKVGVHYVSVASHFEGHGVCGSSDDWIYGTRHFWPQGLFHPNAKGQREYSNVVNRYLESIKTGWPEGYLSPGIPRNPAPGSGSSGSTAQLPMINNLEVALAGAPAQCESARRTVAPGASITVSGRGFATGTSVSLSLRIANQTIALGSSAASSGGVYNRTLTLPDPLPEATQATIEALGRGSNNNGLLLVSLVKVVSSVALDADGDGVPDGCDNCPFQSNTDQQDLDSDGSGDVCDACPLEAVNDEDGDGMCAPADACPLDPDNDLDGDGICAQDDNCATVSNASQRDVDGNGIGDACEDLSCFSPVVTARAPNAGEVTLTPSNCGAEGYFTGTPITLHADPNPGLFFTGWTGAVMSTNPTLHYTVTSNAALTANFCSSPIDSDRDNVGDSCDNCPRKANPDQKDTNKNGIGDACEPRPVAKHLTATFIAHQCPDC